MTCFALPSTTNPKNFNASDLDRLLLAHRTTTILMLNFQKYRYDKSIEWLSFWDQFSVAVDSKTSILDVVKFSYFKGVLNKDVQKSICLLAKMKIIELL